MATGIVAKKEREGLKRTCFQGQCTGAMQEVVESDVWNHMVGKMEQSVLIKIGLLHAVKGVS